MNGGVCLNWLSKTLAKTRLGQPGKDWGPMSQELVERRSQRNLSKI